MSVMAAAFPVGLGVIMFGLGLTLRTRDFAEVLHAPRAVFIALGCQIIVLPTLGLSLVSFLPVNPSLAVGIMVLLATPGGAVASIFSHLAGGDVALNITLTAMNSVLAILTLPVIVTVSMEKILGGSRDVGLRPDKLLQVFAFVVIPTAIGMWVRHRYRAFAKRMGKPLKIGSVVLLVLGLAATLVQGLEHILENLLVVGTISLLLSTASVLIGYWVPSVLGVSRPQSIAASMEVGIHNGALALTVAITVLGDPVIAISPAIYNIVVYVPILAALYSLARGRTRVPVEGRTLLE